MKSQVFKQALRVLKNFWDSEINTWSRGHVKSFLKSKDVIANENRAEFTAWLVKYEALWETKMAFKINDRDFHNEKSELLKELDSIGIGMPTKGETYAKYMEKLDVGGMYQGWNGQTGELT